MSKNTFFMLGVIHRDKEGPALLQYWLNRIQPDSVTLELSRYGIRFRKEFSDEYKGRIDQILGQRKEKSEPRNEEALEPLFSYISIPYEYEIVSEYAAEQGIPFYLIDMDFFSYVKLRAIEDLVSEENIEKMLADMQGSDGNREMIAARLYFEKGITIVQYDREMYVRDKFMSSKIQDLMEHNNYKKFLHVCGWQHLQDPSNLYSHLNPIKVFSHDKTFCI